LESRWPVRPERRTPAAESRATNFPLVKFEIIRDPLWNNIRVDAFTMRLVDTPAFQRLRYVRQLGLAYLVYPGATHSRFEHALGTYHLARRTVALLEERGELASLPADEPAIIYAAALLHDIGHYPFSHALEEIGALHHENVAGPLITGGEIGALLNQELGKGAAERVHALVTGISDSALQGLISGSLDLDKIEYLKRDALMCGVPYGEVDVDRLTNSMVVLKDPATDTKRIGVVEKALAAIESLLFAKYQMYRNVYWHHTVRSATAMYKRIVDDALRSGAVRSEELATFTDEGLLHRLESRHSPILSALRERRLYKRAAEWPAATLSEGFGDWIAEDRARVVAIEDSLAREAGLEPGELLLDYPLKTQMLGLDLPVVRRDGSIERLTDSGWKGTIDLPSLSDQLYRSTRWLRVFTARAITLDRDAVMRAITADSR
jgi:HD superfamily phosphohydrolase